MKLQAFFIACILFPAIVCAAGKPLLVLDSGHTPKNGGALSISGSYEVIYNDRFASSLQKALQQAGWRVLLTRLPGQETDLSERAALANRQQATIFLSIHHDSAQPKYLQETVRNGQKTYRTTQPIRGYSLFVSALNPQYRQSQQLASDIGRELLKIGRKPSLHHAEPITGENRELLDVTNGVYRYDQLAVLRQTTMPAVLLEVGVIVDEQDEAYVSRAENREAMIRAVVRALQPYQRF